MHRAAMLYLFYQVMQRLSQVGKSIGIVCVRIIHEYVATEGYVLMYVATDGCGDLYPDRD